VRVLGAKPNYFSLLRLMYAARDAVWTGSLARVNTLKCLTHIGHRGGEPTVLGSRPRQWHCVILKAGEEGV
jgi:hypothetical protein